MKILITGVAGFIGSNMAEYFLSKNYEVVGLDVFDDYYPRKVKEFNISTFKDNPKFKLYEVDLVEKDAINEIFEKEKFERVIHLAARAGVTPSVKNPHVYAMSNYVGTDNLASAAVKTGVKQIMFASTSSVYGTANKVPFSEDMDTSHPAAPYPASKKGCEVLLYTYHLNFGIDVVVFRFFNPIGPRLRPDMALPKLIRAALYDQDFPVYQNINATARDYTYIKHMMEAHEAAMQKSFGYEIMNLGNSNPVTLADFLNLVEEKTHKRIKLIENPLPGQMEITHANTEKAKTLIDYYPSTTLKEMVDVYYDWFIQQPDWYKKGEY